MPLDSTPHLFDSQFFADVSGTLYFHVVLYLSSLPYRRYLKVLSFRETAPIMAKFAPQMQVNFVCNQTTN